MSKVEPVKCANIAIQFKYKVNYVRALCRLKMVAFPLPTTWQIHKKVFHIRCFCVRPPVLTYFRKSCAVHHALHGVRSRATQRYGAALPKYSKSCMHRTNTNLSARQGQDCTASQEWYLASQL